MERSPASSLATARKKFYAVAVGRQIGIFDKWASAKAAVERVPKAVYCGFVTLDEAKERMRLQMQNRRERELASAHTRMEIAEFNDSLTHTIALSNTSKTLMTVIYVVYYDSL